MPESIVDLSTVPTNELLDEVLSRHCASLFVAVRIENDTDGAEERTVSWTGGMSTVIGLLTIAKTRLLAVSLGDTVQKFTTPESEE